jgi:hypothetical protein
MVHVTQPLNETPWVKTTVKGRGLQFDMSNSHPGLHNFVDLGCNDHAPYSDGTGLDDLNWGDNGGTHVLYHDLGPEGYACEVS